MADRFLKTAGFVSALAYTAEFVSVHALEVELKRRPVTREVSLSKGVDVTMSVKASKTGAT